MTRRRDLDSSDWFHVVQKGADAQDIFSAPSHRTVYGEVMADAFERAGVELHAYAWMTNHTHALCHAPRGGLPEAMHALGTRYAIRYNSWTDRSGPLFTSRFFSKPIVTDEQLVQTARYIHRNPLPLVGVRGLSTYRWSSMGALTGRVDRPDWLTVGVVTDGWEPGAYERFVVTQLPSDRKPFGDLAASVPTSCDEIEIAVAAVTGRSVDELRRSRGMGTDHARTAMIGLAVDLRSASSAALASRYGLSDQRSVRRIARRSRVLQTQSLAFATLVDRSLAALDRPSLAA